MFKEVSLVYQKANCLALSVAPHLSLSVACTPSRALTIFDRGVVSLNSLLSLNAIILSLSLSQSLLFVSILSPNIHTHHRKLYARES